MQEPVVPDFHEPRGKDMLQKTSDKLHDIQPTGPPTVAFSLFVLKRYHPVFNLDDPGIGYAHFKHIRSQILCAFNTGTGWFAVHVPVPVPAENNPAGQDAITLYL